MSRARTLTIHEWNEEGERLFGTDRMKWRFVCPFCNTKASVADYTTLHAPVRKIGRACIGNFIPDVKALGDKATGPCLYIADSGAPVRILDDGESDYAFAFDKPNQSPEQHFQ
jgi:hypothetical protein